MCFNSFFSSSLHAHSFFAPCPTPFPHTSPPVSPTRSWSRQPVVFYWLHSAALFRILGEMCEWQAWSGRKEAAEWKAVKRNITECSESWKEITLCWNGYECRKNATMNKKKIMEMFSHHNLFTCICWAIEKNSCFLYSCPHFFFLLFQVSEGDAGRRWRWCSLTLESWRRCRMLDKLVPNGK